MGLVDATWKKTTPQCFARFKFLRKGMTRRLAMSSASPKNPVRGCFFLKQIRQTVTSWWFQPI